MATLRALRVVTKILVSLKSPLSCICYQHSIGMGDDCCAKAAQSAKMKKRPCQRHMQSATSRFQPTLDALGCICRALFALNLESCCVKGQNTQRESRRSGARIYSPRRSSAISLERTKGDGYY